MPKAGKDNSKGENKPGCGRVFPRGGDIRDLTKYSAEFGQRYRDTGLDCYRGSGIRQNLGKKMIFGIAMTEVQGAEFSWKRGGKAGSESFLSRSRFTTGMKWCLFLKPNVSRPRHLCVRNL